MSQNVLIEQFRTLCPELESQPTEETPKLNRLEGIRAVVFDVYGTLFASGVGDISLVSKEERGPVISQVLEDFGCPVENGGEGLSQFFYDTIAKHQGRRREQGIQYPEVEIRAVWESFLYALKAEGRISEVPRMNQIEQISVAFECGVNPVGAFEDTVSTLDAIRGRGLKLGIVSNAQYFTPLLFDAFAGRSYKDFGFDQKCCVWSWDILEAKPSVALYDRSAAAFKKHYGIEAHEVFYVGNDMRNDVWPAQLAGYKTGLFAGDARSLRWRKDDPNCADVVPDVVLTSLSQILEVV